MVCLSFSRLDCALPRLLTVCAALPDLFSLMVTPRPQMPIRGLSRRQASASSACLVELHLLLTKWKSLIGRPLPGVLLRTPWIWNDHHTITFPARAIIFPVLTWMSDLSDARANSEGASSFRRFVWTLDQLENGNVGIFQPGLQRVAADRAVCVTGVWHQELFFGAPVLGAAIGTSDNLRHSGRMRFKPEFFQRNAGWPFRPIVA